MSLRDLAFDLDGTLVDSRPGIDAAAAHAVQTVWPGREPVSLAPFIGPPIREMLARVYPDASAAELDALFTTFREAYDGGTWRETTLYDGAREVFEALAAVGGRAFVVTNKRYEPTQLILDHFGLTEQLVEIRSPDTPGASWGGKGPCLTELARRYALDSSTAAYVGDAADDRTAAQLAGLPFVAVSYGYGTAGRDGDDADLAVIEHLAHLSSMVLDNAKA